MSFYIEHLRFNNFNRHVFSNCRFFCSDFLDCKYSVSKKTASSFQDEEILNIKFNIVKLKTHNSECKKKKKSRSEGRVEGYNYRAARCLNIYYV